VAIGPTVVTVKKRPNGTGSLVERPPGSGRWLLRVAAGPDPVTGVARRKSWTFAAKGRRAAELEATRLIEALEGSIGTTATLQHLLDEYLRMSEARGRSPTTLHEYRRIATSVLVPSLGKVPLDELTAHLLDVFYAGSMTGVRAVSASSVRRYHGLLSAALNQAVKWGWIDRNPASRATPPTASVTRLNVPTAEEVRELIAACRDRSEQLGMFVLLAAVTGCRRGELAALRWRDIQGDRIAVSSSVFSAGGERGVKSTKSGRERVVIAGEQVMMAIDAWSAKVHRDAADWGVTVSSDAFVLSTRPGGDAPPNVDTVTTSVRRVADSIGLRHVHLHSLRHFAATELLGTGINARDAAERLGHADPTMTLRVYAHATSERQRAAANAADRVLFGLVTGAADTVSVDDPDDEAEVVQSDP
jgi:integrase